MILVAMVANTPRLTHGEKSFALEEPNGEYFPAITVEARQAAWLQRAARMC